MPMPIQIHTVSQEESTKNQIYYFEGTTYLSCIFTFLERNFFVNMESPLNDSMNNQMHGRSGLRVGFEPVSFRSGSFGS